MNDAKLEQLIKPLIKIFDSIELELIKDIAIRLNTYSGVKGTLKWYLDKLQEMGGFTKDNLALIAEYAGKSQKEVRKILKYAGYNMTGFDRYKEYYEDNLLKINPSSIYESVAIKNIINNAVKETNSLMETIQTKALESAKNSYMKILTDSYIKVSSGVYSYDTAIRMDLKELAKEGFTGATYKGGKKLSLEATVRRDILTKTRQLAGSIELENAKELGTNLVYVTQHLGARIRTKYTKEDYEVHADWQGKVYMLEGSSDKYDNFYEKTGYGELLGLKGVNCRHHFYPTFEWEKHPERLDPKENEKEYLKQQEQRKQERKMRSLKREKEIAKQLRDKDELKKINSKMKTFNAEYDKWLEENNLQRDYSREYIEKDLVKNSLEDSKTHYNDVTQEWLDNATPNSHIVQDKDYFESIDGNKYFVDGKNVVLDYSNKEKEVAEWLENTFGGEIYMLPKINKPDGIMTADYLYKNELWDLKEINGVGKNILFHAIEKHEKQAHNFIFDATNSKLTNVEILQRLDKLYSIKKVNWLEQIIVKRKNEIIIITQKSSPSD